MTLRRSPIRRVCAVCGGIAECTHHVLPRSRGGKHTAANLLPLCHRCHQDVHNRPEWAREKGFLR